MSRYSDIRRGGELKVALDNYVEYLQEATTRDSPRFTGRGTPTPRGKTDTIGVRLFGVAMGVDEYVTATVSEAALGGDGANFDAIADFGTGTGKRVEFTVDTDNVVGEPTGFKRPARLTVFKPAATGAPEYKQSKVTKLYYIKYPGKSHSIPFGRKQNADGTTERFADARAQLITLLKGDGSNQFPRVSIREEDYDGNA